MFIELTTDQSAIGIAKNNQTRLNRTANRLGVRHFPSEIGHAAARCLWRGADHQGVDQADKGPRRHDVSKTRKSSLSLTWPTPSHSFRFINVGNHDLPAGQRTRHRRPTLLELHHGGADEITTAAQLKASRRRTNDSSVICIKGFSLPRFVNSDRANGR